MRPHCDKPRVGLFTFAATAIALLSGCEGSQSALQPAGPAAQDIALLWWWMLGTSAVIVFAVVGLWLYAQFRRPPPEQAGMRHTAAVDRIMARRWLIGGGLVLPTVTMVVLLAFGIPMGHRMLPLPLPEAPLRIEVTGHQWWWEVHYPEQGITTANQIHIPAGRPVDFHLASADVIHAFWVPQLGGKLDMIPGRTNVLRLQADAPGRFRGQCAEFCGLQHARMRFTVEALPEDAFAQWVAARQADEARPIRDADAPSAQVFEAHCSQCHSVAGAPATGGPDLRHLHSRTLIGAGTLHHDGHGLKRWLREHQHLKPGNHMPAHDHLDDDTLSALVDWLRRQQ